MHDRPIHDGQAMFDVSLHAAHGRIADLQAGGRTRPSAPGTVVRRALRIRHALGVRLLVLGAALVADEPTVVSARPLARG